MTASPCTTCDGICCRTYSIEVTAFDIRRIAEGTGVAPEQFCSTIPSWAGRCAIAPSRIDGALVNIVLRQSAAKACLFYVGGNKACGIYAHRPRSCSIYPFRVGIRYVALLRNTVPCPSPWDSKIHAIDMPMQLALLEDEIRIHNRVSDMLDKEAVGEYGVAAFLRRLLAGVALELKKSRSG